MAVPSSLVYEGDIILLYCPEARGYLYSDTPGKLRVFIPEKSTPSEDPVFPNVHFAAFEILPFNAKPNSSTQKASKSMDAVTQNLVYGQMIKLLHMASRKLLCFLPQDKEKVHSVAYLADWKEEMKDDCLLRVQPAQTEIRRQRAENVLTGDFMRLECVTQTTSYYILFTDNTETSRFEVKVAKTDSVFHICKHISRQEEIPHRAIRGAAVVLIQNVHHDVYLSSHQSIVDAPVQDNTGTTIERSGDSVDGPQELDTEQKPTQKEPITKGKDGGKTQQALDTTLSTLFVIDSSIPLSRKVFARKSRNIHSSQRISLCGDTFWQLEDYRSPYTGESVQFGRKVCIKHVPSQLYLAVRYRRNIPQSLTLKKHCSDQVMPPEFAFMLIQEEKSEGILTNISYVEIKHTHGEYSKSVIINTSQAFCRPLQKDGFYEDNQVYGLSLVDRSDTQLSRHQVLFKIEEVKDNFVQDFYHALGVTSVLLNYQQKICTERADLKLTYVDDVQKQAFEVTEKLDDWMRLGGKSQIRAEMLLVTKAVSVMKNIIYHNSGNIRRNCRKLLGSICTLLECFVIVGGKRCSLYLVNSGLFLKLAEMVGSCIEVEKVLSAVVRNLIIPRNKVSILLLTLQSQIRKKGLSPLEVVALLDTYSTLCVFRGRPLKEFQDQTLLILLSLQEMLITTEFKESEASVIVKKPEKLNGKTLQSLKPEFRKMVASQIRLLSQVCKGNKESISKVCGEKLVTVDVAFHCIQDNVLDPVLRSAYLNFIISTSVGIETHQWTGTSVDEMLNTFDWSNPVVDSEMAVCDAFHGIYDEQHKKRIQNLHNTVVHFLKKCTALYAIENVAGTNELIIQMLNAMASLVSYGFCWNSGCTSEILDTLLSLIDRSSNHFICDANGIVKPNNVGNRVLYQIMSKALDILYLFFLRVSYMALENLVYDYGFLNANTSGRANYTRPKEDLKNLISHECSIPSELMKIARLRLRYYFKRKGYEFFEDLGYTSNNLIKFLTDMLCFEDDNLRVSSCRLLFLIFQAEKTLFSEAQDSYIYTESLQMVHNQLVNFDNAKDSDTLKLPGKIKLLDHLAELLIMDGNDFLPNPVNQNLAYSRGLVNRLLEDVLLCTSAEEEDMVDDVLMTKTCLVLQRCARGNAKVQAKMFERYTELLSVSIAPGAVAEVLTEIFIDNAELCRKVSQADLSNIFYIACTDHSKAELFTTLQAITKTCKSSPDLISSFQDSLARLFLESVQSEFKFLLANFYKQHTIQHTMLLDILKRKYSDDPILEKVLNVCDLLNVCCEGVKKFPEDVCQAIFSVKLLIRILGDTTILLERKKPFACLLTEVYLVSDRQSLKVISSLEESRVFWAHIRFASELMTHMSCTLKQYSSSESTKIKTLLCHLANHHLSLKTWIRLSEGISTTVYHPGVRLSSALLYLIEGFLPMITAFCNQLSQKYRAEYIWQLTSKEPEKWLPLKEVGDAVVQVLQNEILADILLCSKCHVQLMKRCLESLNFFIPNPEWKSHKKTLLTKLDGLVLPSLRYSIVNADLASAVGLNKSFMQFVENYRHAYIGETNNGSVGENLVSSDPSFKALISCFHYEGTTKQRVDKLKPLVNFLHGLCYRLQDPLPYKERSDLDFIIFTILQLLSAIILPRNDITQSYYENVVKPLQEALINIKPHGAHKCAIIHLGHSQKQVALQAMAFLAALVYGGNENTQQKIGQYLKHRDTELFVRMNVILELASERIKDSPVSVKWFGGESDGWPQVETGRKPEDAFQPVVSPTSDIAIEMTTYQPIGDDDYDLATYDQERVTLIQPDQTSGRKKTKEKQTYVMVERELDATDHQEAVVEVALQQVKVVLDLVAWMCHGQKTENQDLFREQEDQFNSVNIVSQVALFLQLLVKQQRYGTIRIALKAIQALTELCTGNLSNQEVAYKAEIVDTVNSLLAKRNADSKKEDKKLLELKSHALELLNILLQEVSKSSCELIHKISRSISRDTILEAMLTLRNRKEEINYMEPDAQKGMFNAFHALKRIGDNLNRPEKIFFDIEEEVRKLRKKQLDDPVEKMMEEEVKERKDKANKIEGISKWSRSIEVVCRSKEQEPVLTRVYFPFHPKVQFSGEERDFIGEMIDRTTQENRYKDLIGWMKAIYERNVKLSSSWTRWSRFLSGPRHYALILLTLLMNILTLIFFKAPTDQGSGSGKNSNSSVFVVTTHLLVVPSGYYLALYLLGSLHLILSIWMLVEYFMNNWEFLRPPISINKSIKQLRQYRVGIIDQYEPSTISLKYFDAHLFGFEPIYRVLFVGFSILSLIFSGYWYCGCLLYLFLKVKLMGQILAALRVSALPLFIVFLLGLCIMFIYAVLSFALFHGYYSPEDGLFCETLAQCFTTVTRVGLLDTLGNAIPLKAAGEDIPSFAVYEWRTLFDLSFYILITTIGLNIVIAIMVDSFSELRTQRDLRASVKSDKQNQCFICGKKSDEFDTKAKTQGFQNHVKNDHNMWNYIYFYIYLRNMDPSDHNAVEKYVYTQIENGWIEFFPCLVAKVLEKHDEEEAKAGIKEGVE